jgi:ArsR family transcriptional regulator
MRVIAVTDSLIRGDAGVAGDALRSRVLEEMPDEERLYDLAELFKVFGDTTRIRILYVLLEAEMCVCDIAEILNMTQSAISHQLRVLKQARLVRNRRKGKQIYYSLADDHVRTIIGQGMDHVNE